MQLDPLMLEAQKRVNKMGLSQIFKLAEMAVYSELVRKENQEKEKTNDQVLHYVRPIPIPSIGQ